MSAKPSRPAMLSIAEAADYLGVNPKTIRRRVADNTIVAYRVGPHLLRLRAEDVEALIRPVPNARVVA